jgi:hypothetical protein
MSREEMLKHLLRARRRSREVIRPASREFWKQEYERQKLRYIETFIH